MTEARRLEALGRTPRQRRIGAQARHSNFGALRLWGDGERLMAQASGQPPFELRADSWGDFYVEGLSAVLSPSPESDAEAPIQRLLWRQDGSVTEGRRVGAGVERPVIAKPA